ncbi:non-hydrolyzing UDP-N-acetylglucosamine 2-epimerase [Persicitalea jodogahamensis]|uniref:UDP-N-acetylglucosamine 2-epimerase (non-hydrolyzing) n=1 Tax=Persicitalea jodogahamensis TaxID=402147 RepID=A0A8J3GAX1_9BACT|nr:UDP-N-acetylglucosamine 2-epimerase (non-hydrolyzing) [Persicitalea jodogahamensis]GHB83310.1 UDP-N-acetylglucosamine 2-epimerase [Persicitalea jodogahamensis]
MKVLTVFGTRPEAIKMAPLVKVLHDSPAVEQKVCSTGQHREMLEPIMSFFDIEADFNLDIMQPGQDLTDITSRILLGMRGVLQEFQPDWVLVHGDTTTALAATLAAFYAGVKVGHVEAGLRTGSLYAPFPEEANRLLVDRLASAYFAPTQRNADNLLREGVASSRILITGNTVVDALLWATEKVKGFSEQVPSGIQTAFENNARVLLVTGHRRENFGKGFRQICAALRTLAGRFPDLNIVYPVHLNPQVQKPVLEYLSDLPNILLAAPMEYPDFVFAMKSSGLILTDSGGIQEEAPSLGKPVLVMRDTTERPEALEAGAVQLVGADEDRIVAAVENWWTDKPLVMAANPYGDGQSSSRISDYLLNNG